MNNELINKKMIPARIIVVYKDGKDYSHDYYLESREVKASNGKYIFGAAVPLPTKVLRDIADAFTRDDVKEMNVGGLVAEHLLYASFKPGKTVVMWYRPAMETKLNFSSSIKIKEASVVGIPAILSLVINEKLYLYALMNNARPNEKTKLYNVPFFNIYEDGNVCLGSAKVGNRQATTFEEEALRFEKGFYRAEQTHVGAGSLCKTPLIKLWNQLIKSQAPFPSATELIQHKKYKTLGDLIDKLIR